MKSFLLELDFLECLGLYLGLAEADPRTARIRESLQRHLYEHLSIAEMEEAEALYWARCNEKAAVFAEDIGEIP